MAGPRWPREMLGLVKAQGRLSWTMCAAQSMSPTSGATLTMSGTHTTVAILLMDTGVICSGGKQISLALSLKWSLMGTSTLHTTRPTSSPL